MRRFNNPLDNIRIASPCTANWDEMYGDDRRRFCADCKLNVYNLSDMTRRQAENLLIDSEGRLCVRFFRRADGTVITRDCPVGWRALKRRVSHVATAVFSMIAGLIGGVAGFGVLQRQSQASVPMMGDVSLTPQADLGSPETDHFHHHQRHGAGPITLPSRDQADATSGTS